MKFGASELEFWGVLLSAEAAGGWELDLRVWFLEARVAHFIRFRYCRAITICCTSLVPS